VPEMLTAVIYQIREQIQSKINLDYQDFIRLSADDYFELPIKATADIKIGAISMILKYPKEFS